MELPFAESWKIKMVEPLRKSTREEREQWIKEADYNPKITDEELNKKTTNK